MYLSGSFFAFLCVNQPKSTMLKIAGIIYKIILTHFSNPSYSVMVSTFTCGAGGPGSIPAGALMKFIRFFF